MSAGPGDPVGRGEGVERERHAGEGNVFLESHPDLEGDRSRGFVVVIDEGHEAIPVERSDTPVADCRCRLGRGGVGGALPPHLAVAIAVHRVLRPVVVGDPERAARGQLLGAHPLSEVRLDTRHPRDRPDTVLAQVVPDVLDAAEHRE